ncbi:hypothetical protein JOM56_008760, partial [Amanita muscaria]
MLSDDPFVRQLEEEQETPRIQSCRWVWCRETFSGRPALNDHVISVHVNHKSVRRSDIPTLRQLEEASSEAFDIIPKALEPNPSSLPSTPTSSPLSFPSALPSPTQGEPSIPYNGQPNNQSVEHSSPLRTPRPEGLNDTPCPSVAHSLPFTPLKSAVEPNFASLSSPADSHLYSPVIPKSPGLSKMVSDTINSCKRRSMGYRDNSPSISSSASSRDSVEKQLTQSMENCSPRSDNNSIKKAGLAKEVTQSQLQTHSVTITRLQSTAHSSARVRRQTWYQGVPKSHLRTSKPSRARRMAATVSHSHKSSRPDGSSGSGASSTPEWPQIPQEEGHTNAHPFPYQTQPSYDSQPM